MIPLGCSPDVNSGINVMKILFKGCFTMVKILDRDRNME